MNAVHARATEAARHVFQAGLVGENPEQLEQLRGWGIARQRDLADAVEVEPLQQPDHAPAPPAPPAPPTGRRAVHLEPAGAHPQRDGRVLQQAEQRAELRLLLIFRGRVTEQAHTACEPRGERLEGRHRGGSI